MSEVIFYGDPRSSYVRSARITCGEKGVAHKLESIELGSEAHRKLHPFAKMPAMRHGDVSLFETSAICRYIDAAFDGPSLQPSDPATQGVMEQWISALNSYVYPHAIRDYALQYIFPRGEGGQPDRKAIEAALPHVKSDLQLLDRAYQGRDWLAGNAFSLADIFVAPVVATVSWFPEGKGLFEDCKNLQRVMSAIESRPAYKAAQPPQ